MNMSEKVLCKNLNIFFVNIAIAYGFLNLGFFVFNGSSFYPAPSGWRDAAKSHPLVVSGWEADLTESIPSW
jgi:hypothetical protein